MENRDVFYMIDMTVFDLIMFEREEEELQIQIDDNANDYWRFEEERIARKWRFQYCQKEKADNRNNTEREELFLDDEDICLCMEFFEEKLTVLRDYSSTRIYRENTHTQMRKITTITIDWIPWLRTKSKHTSFEFVSNINHRSNGCNVCLYTSIDNDIRTFSIWIWHRSWQSQWK